jgi:hypothetical protein
MTWPPTLADYKREQKVTTSDSEEAIQQSLDAAVAFVERVRDDLNFSEDPLSDKKPVTADVFLGTIRLASRWYVRRNTPQGLIQMNDLGQVRLPAYDADIERQLGVGRYRRGMFA